MDDFDLFEYSTDLDFGELHIKSDPDRSFRTIVAIHNLNRGPAIGGCRFIEYEHTDDALWDVMRLARGMTYKAAMANLDHGGAKAVMLRPPELTEDQRARLFSAFGDFVDSLGGDYITAEDSGTEVEDMNTVRSRTEYVLGVGEDQGGAGDPSPYTAVGVRRGMEAAVQALYGRSSLDGLSVAIQGVGNVGYHLVDELVNRGANLTVTDVDEEALQTVRESFDVEVVEPKRIYDVECDIFAPCALGAVLNDETISRLSCDIVAGSANNQLKEEKHDTQLLEENIFYAPDYVINAGGLIYLAEHFAGEETGTDSDRIQGIYDNIREIYQLSEKKGVPPGEIADQIAEERFKTA